MMEVGPIRVNENGTLREVSGWNEYSNVLFRTCSLLNTLMCGGDAADVPAKS